jgi:hypothetical protein
MARNAQRSALQRITGRMGTRNVSDERTARLGGHPRELGLGRVSEEACLGQVI